MLTALRLSGFAIVDRVEVAFRPGLNVLTGETGAGKSILLEALHLALGGRMGAEVLREGAEEAVVEALFELPLGHPALARLEAAGLASPDREAAPGAVGASPPVEVLVRRTASRSGRGRALVNGALCTVSLLERCLSGLVDMTGQHEHVAMLDPSTHLDLLDAFAGASAPTQAGEGGRAGADGGPSLLDRYREAYAALRAALAAREALRGEAEERERRAEYLAFQLRELTALDPQPGEDAALERERQILASAEKLREAARHAEALVYGDEGSSAEGLGRAVRALVDPAGVDPRLLPTLALLRSSLAEAEEAGRELARYAEAVGGDPDRLAEVTERLAALHGLVRKHGGSLEAALARAETMRAELAAALGSGERLAALEVEVAGAGARAVAAAAELTACRSKAAREFARAVKRELESLAMGRCRLEVEFLAAEQPLFFGGVALGAKGAERAQILLAQSAGEAALPLARVASGGELSRVLLAAKRVLARTDPCGTYVFDEVDAGIGGAVAEAVGCLLAEVGRERQVLCVTHLPQVACHASHHLKVEKQLEAGRTTATVRPLAPEEREGEVARMLAGATVTGLAREHARELIATAHSRSAAEATLVPRVARPRAVLRAVGSHRVRAAS